MPRKLLAAATNCDIKPEHENVNKNESRQRLKYAKVCVCKWRGEGLQHVQSI